MIKRINKIYALTYQGMLECTEKEEVSKIIEELLKNRIGMEKRPKTIEKRVRFGDLEMDLIIGKNNNQAMVTINDRASEMITIGKVIYKDAKIVTITKSLHY